MAIHSAAQVEQQVPRNAPDDPLLSGVGAIVEHDDHHKGGDRDVQQAGSVGARHQGIVDGAAHDQRDAELRDGERQHTGDAEPQLQLVGLHEMPEAPHDDTVERRAEHLLFIRDL